MFTEAYVDLMFAWGHARLGDSEVSCRLMNQATRSRHSPPHAESHIRNVHSWLVEAFRYRIDQALADLPHRGPLSSSLLEQLSKMTKSENRSDQVAQYAIDTVRFFSQIVEPSELVDPYLPWRKGLTTGRGSSSDGSKTKGIQRTPLED